MCEIKWSPVKPAAEQLWQIIHNTSVDIYVLYVVALQESVSSSRLLNWIPEHGLHCLSGQVLAGAAFILNFQAQVQIML